MKKIWEKIFFVYLKLHQGYPPSDGRSKKLGFKTTEREGEGPGGGDSPQELEQ